MACTSEETYTWNDPECKLTTTFSDANGMSLAQATTEKIVNKDECCMVAIDSNSDELL